jgi:multicomponent Na+:H+ antiporter subunit D
MRNLLLPTRTITLDLDWFYRMFGRLVLWLAQKPIQKSDTAVNNAYNTWGLNPLMTISRFWSWFDWHAIDGVVDGLARTVRGVGDRVRQLQAARLQLNVFYTVSIVAVLLVLYVFAN